MPLPAIPTLLLFSSISLAAVLQAASPDTSFPTYIAPAREIGLTGVLLWFCTKLYTANQKMTADMNEVRAAHTASITKILTDHSQALTSQAVESMKVMTLVMEAVKEARNSNDDLSDTLTRLTEQIADLPCALNPRDPRGGEGARGL